MSDIILTKVLGYKKQEYLEVPDEKKADTRMDFSA